MKVLGTNSISSFLKFTLTAVWWLQLLILGLFFMLMLASLLGYVSEPTIDMHINFVDKHAPYEIEVVSGGAEGAKLQIEGAKLSWKATSARFITFVTFMGAMSMLSIALFVTYILREIFSTLSQGNAFIPENAYRLRMIAWVFLALAPVTFFLNVLVNFYVMSQFSFSSGAIVLSTNQFNWTALFTGLVMLVVAELFQRGAILQENEDLTV